MKFLYKSSLSKDALLCTIMTFVVAGLLYFIFINLTILDPFEKAFKDFKFTDIYYAERLDKQTVNSNIILVNIKHADRFQLAQAIEVVSKQNPKAIGLDIIFKDQKSQFTDSILKSTLANTPNIVTAYYHENDSTVTNHSYFEVEGLQKGFINLNLNGQNTVIRDFLGAKKENQELSFTSQLAKTAGYIDEEYAIKKLNEPLPINYIGNKDAFLNFSIDEVLNTDEIPAIKDAVVIFGYLGNGNEIYDIEDKHFTPLNKAWVGRAVPDTYGVAIHANILNMLINKNYISKVSNFIIYLIAFIITYITVLLSMKLYKRNSFIYDLTEKAVQLIISVILLYLALLMLQANVYVNIMPIIILPLFGIGMIDFYEHLVIFLNNKFEWKSQLL